MFGNLIIYGIYSSLIGMILAACFSLSKKMFKTANAVLALANVLGFFSGIIYLFTFSGHELVIGQLPVFLNAKLSLTYLSAVFFSLVNGIAVLVTIYSAEYLDRYRETYDISMVQFLTSLFILGMSGVLLSGNAILFMFFWEMMSVASFFLVMSDGTEDSARAAFIYFVMTHLGAAAILGGFLVLSQGSLMFSLNDIATATAHLSPAMVSLSFVLFFFGFGSKAGLIPFHVWLPEAHPQAPTNVSALMSGLMLKVAVFGFIRIIFSFSSLPSWASILVITLGVVSAFFGALYAAIARDIKRAFAFSSIENMGIIFLMLGVALYVTALKAGPAMSTLAILLVAYAVFHAINHAVFKTGLFLSSGVIINKVHSKSMDVMGGIAKAMPYFSVVFLIVILGSAALPPFGAFYGEWGFIRTLISLLEHQDLNTSSLVIFLSILPIFALVSGLAVFAMVKIFGISMLGLPRTELHEEHGGNDNMLVAPIAILAFSILLLGVFARNILSSFSYNLSQNVYPGAYGISDIPISSAKIFGIFMVFIALALIFYKVFSRNEGKERGYHTWDCGQPINSGMEYTSTAFSAPVRFFFLPLLQRNKALVTVPIVDTNPWITKKSFKLYLSSAWQDKFYKPFSKAVYWTADKIKLIHTGRIQYYLLLLLVTVIITLIIAL